MGQLVQKVVGQQRDVFAPLCQGGQQQRDDVEPVVQVFAELACGHGGFQIAVRGRDDAHVDLYGLARAHGPNGPLLQHPQQLHLQRGRHVANLVQ